MRFLLFLPAKRRARSGFLDSRNHIVTSGFLFFVLHFFQSGCSSSGSRSSSPPTMSGVQWGRGTGEGIGLSGHKNEYKQGVRIGNWVEEQFGREAPMSADSLKV